MIKAKFVIQDRGDPSVGLYGIYEEIEVVILDPQKDVKYAELLDTLVEFFSEYYAAEEVEYEVEEA